MHSHICDREQKIFGKDIHNKYTVLSIDSDNTPESRSNTVSLMKAEGQMNSCRNILAVTENYICYSVRKNLLRVINTVSTEKTLLRGKFVTSWEAFVAYASTNLFTYFMIRFHVNRSCKFNHWFEVCIENLFRLFQSAAVHSWQ